jgi:hypothetical protein
VSPPHARMHAGMQMIATHEDAALKMTFEYLHKRDDDLSVKAGAVLGFAGLLIASTLVLLAAEPDTVLHVPVDEAANVIAVVGLALLFAGAALLLIAIASGRAYEAEDAEALIAALEHRLRRRETVWCLGGGLTVAGSFAAGVAYALVLAINLAPSLGFGGAG